MSGMSEEVPMPPLQETKKPDASEGFVAEYVRDGDTRSWKMLMEIRARVYFMTHLSVQVVLYQLNAMLDMVLVHVNSLDLDPGGVERFACRYIGLP